MDIIPNVIIGVGAAASGAIYQIRRNRGDFDNVGRLKRFGIMLSLMFVFMSIPSCAYLAWKTSGFQAGDARNAEGLIQRRYLADGAIRAEAHFIVTGRSSMTGYVDVRMPAGERQTLSCKAVMGDSAEYIVTCQP